MRLQLPRLFGCDREQGGAASQSLRPRRQGNRPDAEDAERGTGKGAGRAIRPGGGCARRGSTGGHGGARPFARQSGRGQHSCRAACSTRPDRKRKPGTSISTSPAPASIMSSAIPSASLPRNDLGHVDQIIALLGRLAHHQGEGQDAARSVDVERSRWRRRRTACSNCFPTSPAARSARRRARWRKARIPTAMPRRST